jgi:hypothetical protein
MDEKVTMGVRPGVSFSYKRSRVLVFLSTLQVLNNPSCVRFLFNPCEKKLAIQECEYNEKDSFVVPKYEKSEEWKTYEISSISMIEMLWECCEWTKNRTYRIFGEYYPGYRLVEFKMSDAVELSEDMFCDSV